MVARVIAGVLAVALGALALFGAILIVFLAASAAEPGTATDRGETLAGSLVVAGLEGLLVAGVLVLGFYAAAGRLVAWPWLAGVPLASALALGLLAGLTL